MKLTPELKLRAAIHLLCQANPGMTYAQMNGAVEDLARQILAAAGPAPAKAPGRVKLPGGEGQHERKAIAKFETTIQKHHRS